MCGIFGLVLKDDALNDKKQIFNILNNLFLYSEDRGREAAGIAYQNGSYLHLYKKACTPRNFIKDKAYLELFETSYNLYQENLKNISNPKTSFSVIGHTRLATNGFQSDDGNNQPISIDNITGIHNGIITNEEELWERNNDLEKIKDVDTELLLKLLDKKLNKSKCLKSAVSDTFHEIEGSASIAAFFNKSNNILLATNTGALFYASNLEKSLIIFASERYILKKIINSKKFDSLIQIHQLKPFNGISINLENNNLEIFSLDPKNQDKVNNYQIRQKKLKTINVSKFKNKELRRCEKCILPETYPFMDFDRNGICRYCREHKPFKIKGEKELIKVLEKYKSKDGNPDCIVALSGGRDSCYGLHYIKKKLGMNPIAFTYDWGLVTDLARRNAARVCGKLGVEHITRTPDIALKRKYVRKNVEAWLNKPELGMVPLFMAGDKAFYHYARKIRKETGVKLVFFCAGNNLENVPYKFGFSGVRESEKDNTLSRIKVKNKIQLISYYIKNFLKNPKYLNTSIWDTAAAFWHTFVEKDDFIYLYHYLDWNEDIIVKTIKEEYDWEISKDTETTWRIGDGTAAFYNYIYSTMAGFTEDDNMLSNMIREGHINREEALKRSISYSKPRIESIMEYTKMIGLNYEETIRKINIAKKIF